MPLQQTPFYRSHLADLHQVLLAHEITQTYLTGTRVRFDGVELGPTNSFEFAFGTLSTLEFVHLFSVFDGSRVHGQAERRPGRDDAPPGMYFTVINAKVIQAGHKNRSGIFSEETGTAGLFIEGIHIDHFFLDKHQTPHGLGAIAFTLGAITAHLAGLDEISLIAAGGKGFQERHVGFKVWPKLGFDAEFLPDEQRSAPHLQGCRTVQDILDVDPAWWEAEGSQRLMTFDLRPGSRSWLKLLTYTGENSLSEVPMTSPTAIRKPAKAAKAAPGRVFNISSKGIPRVTTQVKAKIEAAARSTSSKRRRFPELISDS